MKKKLLVLCSIVVVLLTTMFIATQFLSPKSVEGAKEIEITVLVDETEEILFQGKVKTDATLLGELLDEVDELKMETEDSGFGRFIISLCDQQQGDIATGPWWLYDSKTNETCSQMGYCPGIDEVTIQDGDDFTFRLSVVY